MDEVDSDHEYLVALPQRMKTSNCQFHVKSNTKYSCYPRRSISDYMLLQVPKSIAKGSQLISM